MNSLQTLSSLKVLFLGNTCNNNFSFLRYLEDLGIDSTLALYSDEGYPDSNPIHSPEWDTFNFDRYSHKIIRLSIPNSPKAIIGDPRFLRLPPDLRSLSRIIDNHDIVIGSGISPSLFFRMKKRMDIFYPISTGIEWVEENENYKKLQKFGIEQLFRRYIYKTQIEGIRSSRQVVSCCGGTTSVLRKHGIPSKSLMIPQYYPESFAQSDLDSSADEDFLAVIKTIEQNTTFKIFAFMRQLWVYNDSIHHEVEWSSANKRNDILVHGFKLFLDSNPSANILLYLSEWGPDVVKSKELVDQLGLDDYVIWLPLMPRKYISYILQRHADIGVGEFVRGPDLLWGSTGWECLAHGIPYMETLNFHDDGFEGMFGFPLPPKILNVDSAIDAFTSISQIYSNPVTARDEFLGNKLWFADYIVKQTLKNWTDLFCSLRGTSSC